ncbi:MAG: tRNA pseudouridine(55) synthase [Lachnospiraceae bacterium]|nr:tRNA pseudouridine(55) synthase [Lachnospiraceae bacterium]
MDGILIVNKEAGFTSHDVVAKLRGILHQKKIGHTGTLDPQAQGVLPVCLGKATKVSSLLTDTDKAYEATLLFGLVTDTQDAQGRVLAATPDFSAWREKDQGAEHTLHAWELEGWDTASAADVTVYHTGISELTEDGVRELIKSFIGRSEQIPPMYSAKKVDGKKLYELAREGKEVERKPATIEIRNITIQSMELPRVRILVECSKGTYIRTLCHDIGQKAGCGAIMESLLRVRSGRFSLPEAKKLAEIKQMQEEGRLEECLIPVDQIFEDCPKGVVEEAHIVAVANGNRLQRDWLRLEQENAGEGKDEMYRIYDAEGRFYGLYEPASESGFLKPRQMFI